MLADEDCRSAAGEFSGAGIERLAVAWFCSAPAVAARRRRDDCFRQQAVAVHGQDVDGAGARATPGDVRILPPFGAGDLGFGVVATFRRWHVLPAFLDPTVQAEETFTVFDSSQVFVLAKVAPVSADAIEQAIGKAAAGCLPV